MHIVYIIWYKVLYRSEVLRSQMQSSSFSRSLTPANNYWYELQTQLFYEAFKIRNSRFINIFSKINKLHFQYKFYNVQFVYLNNKY